MSAVTTQTKRLGSGKLFRGGTAGTAMGAVKSAHVRWGAWLPIPAEEINGPWELLYLGDDVQLTCVLEGHDTDAMSVIAPNQASGYPRWPGTPTVPAGCAVSAIANLVFVPDNALFPGVKLLSAVAEILQRGDGIALAGRGHLETIVRFRGLPDASDNVGLMDVVANL